MNTEGKSSKKEKQNTGKGSHTDEKKIWRNDLISKIVKRDWNIDIIKQMMKYKWRKAAAKIQTVEKNKQEKKNKTKFQWEKN